MTNPPVEKTEAFAFVEWCNIKNLDVWHIINECSIKNFAYFNIMKKLGWRKGISDYLIYLPSERCISKRGGLLWIELKRCRRVLKNGKLGRSPSSVQPEQIDFIEKMQTCSNVDGAICYGWVEASEFVEKFLI